MSSKLKCFKYSVNEDSVALVTIDLPGEKVNKFSTSMMKELKVLIEELKSSSDLKGAVFISAKKDIFIAGADINEIAQIKPSELDRGKEFIFTGQTIFSQLADLPFPTCSAIDGACMGGGLEFTLATDFRIATNNPKTVLALPEVKLGLIPGWGGTQRFTRLVGAYHAIDFICSGRNIYPTEAYDIGLIDDLCSNEDLTETALQFIRDEISCPTYQEKRKRLQNPLQLNEDQVLFTFGLARPYIYGETKGHYPAPMAALDAIQEGFSLPLNDGLKIEAEKFIPLLESDVTRNLINLFMMSNELKKERGIKNKEIQSREINSVGVLGAGIMGGGLLQLIFTKGFLL